jgi:hypothetical protein
MIDNYIIKPSDTTRASTTTVAADPDLVVPVVANSVYLIEFVVWFAGLQAAGFKTDWSVPAGTSFNKRVSGPGSANAIEGNANTTELRWAVHGQGTAVSYTNPRNSAGLTTYTVETAIATIAATAGNVTLRWAQNTSNATGTVVITGSHARYRQIG